MRELRESHHFTLKDISGHIGHEFSTLARYERGEWPLPKIHVTTLLDIYAVFDEVERENLLALAEHGLVLNHWHQPVKKSLRRSDAGELITEDWLIEQAVGVQAFATSIVPVYLQTEAYANEVVSPQIREEGAARVRPAVHKAMQLRATLTKLPHSRVQTLIDESLLQRMPGNQLVVRDQLDQLSRVVRSGRTDLRVVPTTAWSYDASFGAFTIYAMPEPHSPVACVRHAGGYLVIEEDGARRYIDAIEEMSKLALSSEESADLIQERVKQLA
jgi:transcriptional regulator with XRE-family HTH domain